MRTVADCCRVLARSLIIVVLLLSALLAALGINGMVRARPVALHEFPPSGGSVAVGPVLTLIGSVGVLVCVFALVALRRVRHDDTARDTSERQ
jgi:hypothetical protein